ncbi:indole-3-glycerol phosphate synthase, chloroplastic-like [Iris pallida]|uniref:indole-3-glycerol-phosphate synthase n=1 Tax=Iris pallida TaxID=29817 RepID=A0AAX6EDT4_IRIPA|nr:indole-3-glycerol phosphate synthase, chloroplastic-like [Iris pallida]
MQSLCLSASARVRVSIPGPTSPRLARSLSPAEWAPEIPMGSVRRSAPLCCTRGLQEASALDNETYSLINSIEVREWESGKSIDDIAANQGIRIRRHPSTNTPRNILEKIIWDKVIEVSELKKEKPLTLVKETLADAPPARDFVGALKASYERNGVPALIAEVKKASPSKGVLREDFDPVEIAKAYEQHGAACLSILTDEKYFQGNFKILEAVRKAGVQCPLLCKEFIIDSWQIYYARSKGADAVLLIAGVLPDIDIKLMTMECRELGLTALLEVHNERELDRVLNIDGIQLIGINNRDLETFEVDNSITKRLLEGERGEIVRKKGIIVVGESGLFTPDDVSYVQNADVKAVLVGESLIKQNDPGKAIPGLFGKEILQLLTMHLV